jgi:hypothetical protein
MNAENGLHREQLIERNPHFNWISLSDFSTLGLGRLLGGVDVAAFVSYLEKSVELPERVAYVPRDERLQHLECTHFIQDRVFGELPIQAGYCVGHSRRMNALEYHVGSEVLVAASPMMLLLDRSTQIVDGRYNSSSLKALYVDEGTVLELFANTLHFAPIEVRPDGFRAGIVLPDGTNLPLDRVAPAKGDLLFAKNKWLIAHPESPSAARGAHVGITGKNLEIVLL